jgi:hypothetical protein
VVSRDDAASSFAITAGNTGTAFTVAVQLNDLAEAVVPRRLGRRILVVGRYRRLGRSLGPSPSLFRPAAANSTRAAPIPEAGAVATRSPSPSLSLSRSPSSNRSQCRKSRQRSRRRLRSRWPRQRSRRRPSARTP